eukprot:m.13438 g.13438  ORF g.13438 m.13438 type:complete len:333 (-) comp2826_c0_seq1:272-1270(-)
MASLAEALRSLNILQPPLVRVEGRQYIQHSLAAGDDGDQDEEVFEEGGEETEDFILIAPNLHGVIVGRQGDTKRRIEAETRTVITVPRKGSTEQRIKVRGPPAGVESALARIELLVDDAVRKTLPSHFVCIPLHSDALAKGLDAFKAQAQALNAKGLTTDAFTPSSKLHLTIGVLRLLDAASLQAARAMLRAAVPSIMAELNAPSGLTATVAKLEYMNDDPSAVDVLYSHVAIDGQGDLLQAIADQLYARFVQAGLIDGERDGVKLHASIIRTRRRADGRVPFDARAILAGLGDYAFGACPLPCVQLCQMKGDEEGYYAVVESVPLAPARAR